jgi:purine-nucleoside/S-methyl-5'-thioadenosine phosphorylase / adenosine deaminase
MTDPALRDPALSAVPGLVHGFLGKPGLPPRDERAETPTDPLCDVKKSLGLAGRVITTARQVHGDRILDVPVPPPKSAGEGDALATDRPGVLLGIFTADCVPVLVVDPRRRVCAAVHAGWRGTAAGVARKAISHLASRYGCNSAELHAAIGPAIGSCCYEVGPEVIAAFREEVGEDLDPFLVTRGERGMIDLRGLNRLALLETGIPEERITMVGPCVSCATAVFHSHRREQGGAGRQLSFVGFVDQG